jgi:hypothetical protein
VDEPANLPGLRPTGLPLLSVERLRDGASGWTVTRERFARPDHTVLVFETFTEPGQTAPSAERIADRSSDIATFIAKLRQRREVARAGQADRDAVVAARFPELQGGASVPSGPLGAIRLAFARCFAPWDLALPDADVAARRAGRVVDRAWTILYQFGATAEGEHLDLFAYSRMTNPRYRRLHEDGRVTDLTPLLSDPLCALPPEELRHLDGA